MNKTILKLIISRAINSIGNIFYDYGNTIWLASQGAVGRKFLAFYQMSDTLTSIIFNPISGALVDRVKRRRILLLTDFICAIACLITALVADNSLMLYTLVIANVVLAISSSFSRIANKSYISEIVEKEQIIEYNSKLELVLRVIGVSSPIFSYIVVRFTSIRVTLLVDAMSFLVSFALIYLIKPSESKYQVETKNRITIRSVLSDIVDGLKYVINDGQILFLLIIACLVNFMFAGFAYLLPFSDQLFNYDGAYASMLSLGAVGSIIAAFVSSKLKASVKVLIVNLLLSGLGVFVIGLKDIFNLPVWVFLFGNFMTEFFMTIFNIHYLSQIQMRVENEYMGRVFSCVFTIAILLMPVGTWMMTKVPGAISFTSFRGLGLGVVAISILAYFYQLKVKNNK